MTKVIGLFPLTGNGGIVSWTKKFLSKFPDGDFRIIPIDLSPGVRYGTENIYQRVVSGLKTLRNILTELKDIIQKEQPAILHTSSSGSIGVYRDYKVGKLCKKHNIKSIIHCHYGRITEDIKSRGATGILLRKSLELYDQIWVLDKQSYNTLKSIPEYADKVFLTPNPIDIKYPIDPNPKKYTRVGFIGNLIPTKGIFDLVEACTKCDVRLDIVGPGTSDIIEKIKIIAGKRLNRSIFIHGRLANNEAVEFMKGLDILALPTYYPWEAFPISILEAMSLSKMVISCDWAAIPDMLTSIDGSKCGLIVPQKSSDAIAKAIEWCQSHTSEADKMCQEAYNKVKNAYETDIVYKLYKKNYRKLLG